MLHMILAEAKKNWSLDIKVPKRFEARTVSRHETSSMIIIATPLKLTNSSSENTEWIIWVFCFVFMLSF